MRTTRKTLFALLPSMFRIQTFFAQNGKDNKPSITTSVTLSKYQPGSIKTKTQSQQGKKMIPYLNVKTSMCLFTNFRLFVQNSR